jgi:DNA-binding MarR family transcriptional regulator
MYAAAVSADATARAAADLRLALGRLVRRVRAESSVPLGQLAVLGLLERDGPQSTADLAAAQLVRHQSMARTVSLLVRAGAVDQRADPSDGRKTVLRITPAGLLLLEHERERRVDWLARAIAEELGEEELPALVRATDLLARLARS